MASIARRSPSALAARAAALLLLLVSPWVATTASAQADRPDVSWQTLLGAFKDLRDRWKGLQNLGAIDGKGDDPESPLERVIGYAFAEASPLLVYSSKEMGGGRKRSFQFGRAYPVAERGDEYLKIKIENGSAVYVRRAHMTFSAAPLWIAGTDAYRLTDRARIRAWKSSFALNEFVSHGDVRGAGHDFEEYAENGVPDSLRLPVFDQDAVEVLGDSRQIVLAGVLVPIARRVADELETVKKRRIRPVDLYMLVDVSGSVAGFLLPVLEKFQDAVEDSGILASMIHRAYLVAFGLDVGDLTRDLGEVEFRRLAGRDWHAAVGRREARGESEPIVDGLMTLSAGLRNRDDTVAVVAIFSGGDVETATRNRWLGRMLDISQVDLDLGADGLIVAGELTPEPGGNLTKALDKLPVAVPRRVFEYSPTLGQRLVGYIEEHVSKDAERSLEKEELESVTDAAREAGTVLFLPSDSGTVPRLPRPQKYAKDGEWYTVRLWVVVDGLVLKLDDRRDGWTHR